MLKLLDGRIILAKETVHISLNPEIKKEHHRAHGQEQARDGYGKRWPLMFQIGSRRQSADGLTSATLSQVSVSTMVLAGVGVVNIIACRLLNTSVLYK